MPRWYIIIGHVEDGEQETLIDMFASPAEAAAYFVRHRRTAVDDDLPVPEVFVDFIFSTSGGPFQPPQEVEVE